MVKLKNLLIKSINEAKFSKDQIEIMRQAYGTLSRMDPNSPTYKKFVKFLGKLPKDQLKQLANAKIKFVSILAKNRIKGESVNEAKPKSYKVKFKCMECDKAFIKSLKKSLEVKCPKCKSVDIELENINESMDDLVIKRGLELSLRDAGFKVKKFKKAKPGYNEIWAGVFSTKNAVIPFSYTRNGDVFYRGGGKSVNIGKLNSSRVLNWLKAIKRNSKWAESVDEGFGGELKGKDKEKFEKARKENAEQLGYKLTGESDIRESVNEGDKKKYWDLYTKWYKTYEAFARETMNLAKSATKIGTTGKTDERII